MVLCKDQTDKLLTKRSRKKQETQITKIKNERKDITTDFIETKRVIGECYEQMDASKFDNLDEMGESPKTIETDSRRHNKYS